MASAQTVTLAFTGASGFYSADAMAICNIDRLGANIMPSPPGVYGRLATIDDLVYIILARILDLLGVPNTLGPRWGEARVAPSSVERA